MILNARNTPGLEIFTIAWSVKMLQMRPKRKKSLVIKFPTPIGNWLSKKKMIQTFWKNQWYIM